MNRQTPSIEQQATTLRARAEKILRQNPPPRELPRAKLQELIHELQVHKIELEMQNETLRQTTIELEGTRNRFSDLYDFAPVGYLTLDDHNIIREANLTAAAMLGVDRAQLIKTRLSRFIVPADQDAFYLFHKNLVEKQTRQVCELRMNRANASLIDVSLEGIAAQDVDDTPILRVTLSDITERNRAKAELRASEARYHQLVETINEGMAIVNANNLTTFINTHGAAILGYAPDEIIGHSFMDFLFPEEIALGEQEIELRRRGIANQMDFRARHKDGMPRWVLASASPIYDSHGKYVGALSIFSDITERKHAEHERENLLHQVKRAREQLQTLSRQLIDAQEHERRHIARELHDEVGQVMSAVKANLETIQLAPDPATLAADLTESIHIVDRALEQIRAIALDLRPSLLDDFGLAPTLDWYLQRQMKRAHLAIAFESDLNDARFAPEIETTAFRFIQAALTNVERHARATQVQVCARRTNDALELSVRDDGVGFDVATARAHARHGVTLGLLALEERVQLVGGALTLTSTPGQGAEIRATIPIR